MKKFIIGYGLGGGFGGINSYEVIDFKDADKQTHIESIEYDLNVSEERCRDLENENQTLQEEYE